jgi:hypothetical protein
LGVWEEASCTEWRFVGSRVGTHALANDEGRPAGEPRRRGHKRRASQELRREQPKEVFIVMLSEFVSNSQEHQNANQGKVKKGEATSLEPSNRTGTTHQARRVNVTTSVKSRTCHQVVSMLPHWNSQNRITSGFRSRIYESSTLIGHFLVLSVGGDTTRSK